MQNHLSQVQEQYASERTPEFALSDLLAKKDKALGIVVIAHNQAASIGLVLNALASQMLACDRAIVVIADPTSTADVDTFNAAVSTVSICSKTAHVEVQFATHGIHGFNAGANRDQGTNYLLGQYEHLSGVVYLDGDCVPSSNVLSSFRNLFAQTQVTKLPVVGCGIRAEDSKTHRTYDCRLNSITHGRSIFAPGVDRVMLHDRHIRASQVCWSCHCGLNLQAIQLLRKTNAALFGDVSRAWASVWDGNYGYEDTFVGLTVFRAGGLVVTLDPATTYVIHQPHPCSANTQKAVVNKQKYPLAATQLARHLQCIHACTVLLHVRGYSENSASPQAGPAASVYDTLEFYNNIISVHVPIGSIEYVALKCLGFNDASANVCAEHTNVQEQVALFQLARTLTIAYGSGAVLAGTLQKANTAAKTGVGAKNIICPHDMYYYANSIWKTLLSACVAVPEFLRVYNSPEQQEVRAQASSIHNVCTGKETESWDEETKHEVW